MKVKLEELVEEVSERTTVNNQHPVLTSSRSGIYLQEEYFKKQVASKDNTGYRIIRKGEFTYRAMSDTGEFYPNKLECTDIGIVSPAYPVFKIKDNRILPDYLKYYFKSRSFQKSITAFVQGSTRASMKFGKMKLISIDLPDKDKQNQILNTIGILESIIDKYELEIDHLNNLIKARFVEMFGNNKYETRIIKDVLRESFWLMPATPKYIDEGIPYITSKNIKNRILDLDDTKFISENDYVKISKNRPIKPGDILISMIGTLGQIAVVSKNKRFYGQNVYLLRLNNDVISTSFFCEFFNSDDVQNKLAGKSNQSTQAYLKANHVEDLLIPVPPIAIQHDFTAFVAHVDKSKFALSNELAMCNFYVCLINDSITHSRIDLRMSE